MRHPTRHDGSHLVSSLSGGRWLHAGTGLLVAHACGQQRCVAFCLASRTDNASRNVSCVASTRRQPMCLIFRLNLTTISFAGRDAFSHTHLAIDEPPPTRRTRDRVSSSSVSPQSKSYRRPPTRRPRSLSRSRRSNRNYHRPRGLPRAGPECESKPAVFFVKHVQTDYATQGGGSIVGVMTTDRLPRRLDRGCCVLQHRRRRSSAAKRARRPPRTSQPPPRRSQTVRRVRAQSPCRRSATDCPRSTTACCVSCQPPPPRCNCLLHTVQRTPRRNRSRRPRGAGLTTANMQPPATLEATAPSGLGAPSTEYAQMRRQYAPAHRQRMAPRQHREHDKRPTNSGRQPPMFHVKRTTMLELLADPPPNGDIVVGPQHAELRTAPQQILDEIGDPGIVGISSGGGTQIGDA